PLRSDRIALVPNSFVSRGLARSEISALYCQVSVTRDLRKKIECRAINGTGGVVHGTIGVAWTVTLA
ncbi:MAG: hypothetical protein KJO06_07875, partial [Gemmatimonadetes bacterium]|nr:hypothetical protein [Gemmatimonadota bacterium]